MATGRMVVLCGAAVLLAVVTLGSVGAQQDGLDALVRNSHLLKCTFNKSLNLDVSLLKLYKYDFMNNVNSSYYLNQSAAAILADPTFDRNRTTLLYIPGFTETIDGPNQDSVRTNLKAVPNSYLYIVDHHDYTYNPSLLLVLSSYERSVKYYWDIGRAAAYFLADLVAGGVNSAGVHVMGHSLGGQIVGAVGEAYINRTGTLLPRIKASDPAGPCFSEAPSYFQLRKGLASYVEVYHCNAGQLGTANDLADASYYANGGKQQPGCYTPLVSNGLLPSLAASCSHNLCVKVVTLPARLTSLWPAAKCDSYQHFQDGDCADAVTQAGFYTYQNNYGIYYFDTTGCLNTTS